MAGAAPLLPRPPRSRDALRIACVGVGGMGRLDLAAVAACAGVRIAALCDVDAEPLSRAAADHPDARTFADYRRLFDAMEREIDAVVVSTPDHMHGPIATAALRRRKHVYCQKPLAHNLAECHRMVELAAQQGLVTQMGIHVHAHPAYRTAVDLLQRGVLGRIREVHCWVGKSWAGPPGGRPEARDPVPATLDWDLWLGAAPERPFVAGLYHPANWRGFTDFGTGTLGDMGCHILDPIAAGLGLGAPRTVRSRGPAHDREVFAADSDVVWTFAATERTQGELTLRWTDGNAAPDLARAGLPPDLRLPGGGSVAVGEHGVMLLPHWDMPRCFRDGKELPGVVAPQPGTDHYAEWVAACRGEGTTSTPFSYAGPLTATVLLGTVAGFLRDRELRWDPAQLRFSDDAANEYVARRHRQGFAPE